jgi:hypothetical protein
MWQARSDGMKVLVLSNLNRQVPPKRLCEKPKREMAGIRESCSCGLGEELEYLTLQCLVSGEQTLGVEYLPDRELLMLFCRNCRRDCPFVFIPLIT